MDLTSLIGTALGVLAVLGGVLLDGLGVGDIAAGASAFVVLGGTLAALLLSFPSRDVRLAFRMIPLVYSEVDLDIRPLIAEITRIAAVARKEGVLAVEGQKGSIADPLFRRAIKFITDGFDPGTVREIIDNEIALTFQREEAAGLVWEGSGGYAPKIGALAAALGLIRAMKSLEDPSKIGGSLSAAFVALLYGVGLANLILIPWGAKIKCKAAQRRIAKEVVKLGVIGIQEGLNPHFLQEKLEVFVEKGL